MDNSSWFLWSAAPREGRVRLFCLPYAGMGGTMFHSWPRMLPDEVEVWPIQLPGRETRLKEQPFADMEPLVRAIVCALRPHLDKPFAMFGHSMGAVVAFETARALRRQQMPMPAQLLVAGSLPPEIPPQKPLLYSLDDDELLRQLSARYRMEITDADQKELLRMMLPTIRADLQVCELYTYAEQPPLACDICAFGGQADSSVPTKWLQGWQQHTTGRFEMYVLPGHHFFLLDQLPRVLAVVSEKLWGIISRSA